MLDAVFWFVIFEWWLLVIVTENSDFTHPSVVPNPRLLLILGTQMKIFRKFSHHFFPFFESTRNQNVQVWVCVDYRLQ